MLFRSASRRDLQSLIVTLSFAATCIPPGRLFIRRLIECLCGTPIDKPVWVGKKLRADLDWWMHNLENWNGRSVFPPSSWTHAPDISFATDASSSIGYGGYMGQHYFHGR